MTSKKSIFEKLGLVEAVEEKNENDVNNSDRFFLDPEDDEVVAEFEEMLKEQELIQSESNVEQPNLEIMQEQNLEETEAILDELDESKNIEEKTSEIEDKLNVLMVAYEKNKMLSIEDIYRNARLSGDTRKSIFIADTFLKTLPENLPVDIKRTSLLNILGVSSISIEELLTDAFQRIDSLNTVLENTVNVSEDIVKKNESAIKELENRIEELKNITEIRNKFQDDQNTLIEYEIQKIINIVDFIKPKK